MIGAMALTVYVGAMAVSIGGEAFERRMRVIGAKIEENSEKIVREAALAADQAVVLGTPVLSGRARGNWIVSTGSPVTTTKDTPSSPAAGEAESLRQGRTVIGQWTISRGAIYITNNLPYIARLEDGYSAQAPAGMVNQARLAADEVLRQGRLLDGV